MSEPTALPAAMTFARARRWTEGPSVRPNSASKWQLDNASLVALMDALGPDISQASQRYYGLRTRLSRFFEWNRADHPEELADETLDRLARRLGQEPSAGRTSIQKPEDFAGGIARLVLHEEWRRKLRADQALQNMKRDIEVAQAVDRSEEARHAEELSNLLDEGMARLSPEQQDLIRNYYSVEGRNQIDARKQLAKKLGVSMNALRNRALRIRAELEAWATEKLNARA